MEDVATRLLRDILYTSRNRLITVTNVEHDRVLNDIELFLEKKDIDNITLREVHSCG